MIKFLIEKEFKQLVRNSFIPKLILIFPCIMMLLMPWAANLEIRNINLCIVDNDHTTYSDRLVRKASSSGYFHLAGIAPSYDKAMEYIEEGRADIILEIAPRFEHELMRGGAARVMISANSVNGTKGALGSTYLATIVNDYADELRQESPQPVSAATMPRIQLSTLNLFNPHLDYKVFMVPGLMVMLLTLLCGFLPALNIVSEKETGTIEQINVTPVNRFTFILAKLIPYWTTGLIVLSVCLLLARVLYGIIPAGNLATIYFFAALYILLISEFGLVISNYSSTMQQAMFVMFFFIIIFVLISGLFTPISSMPEWAQKFTVINPLKYFIQAMRLIYLKGSGIAQLGPQLLALCSFVAFFSTWVVISYKKKD